MTATPAYEVREINSDIGRGLFAARPLSQGEVIFRESPLVSSQFAWNVAYHYSCCHFCLEPLETAQANVRRLTKNPNVEIPHPECCSTRLALHVQCPDCQVGYCSQDCLRQAWHLFHKTLCRGVPECLEPEDSPWKSMVDIWKQMHYPPETTSISLMARILASIVQAPDPGALTAKYLSFMHTTVSHKDEIAHKLLGDGFVQQLEHLRCAMVPLFPQPILSQFLSPEGFLALFALVGRNGQGVATSPWSQWVKNVEDLSLTEPLKTHANELIESLYEKLDEEVGSFLDNEGSGLYQLQSLANHSCVPNAEVQFSFNNHDLVVKAIQPIQPGEEILISYLDECLLSRSRKTRNEVLRENYLFNCLCPKCQEQINDPEGTSEEEMSEEEG